MKSAIKMTLSADRINILTDRSDDKCDSRVDKCIVINSSTIIDIRI